MGFEYFCGLFKTFPCLWLGRGNLFGFTSYVALICCQVVPDGFGVAYMTGYEGKNYPEGTLVVLLLMHCQTACNLPLLPGRSCRMHNSYKKLRKPLKTCMLCINRLLNRLLNCRYDEYATVDS